MANELRLLYWENDALVERFAAMGDTNKMGDDVQIPKDNLIAMAFSTKVQGIDTRVRYLEKFDLYQVSMNNSTNVDSMYGWDDNDGGWFRHAAPLAVDGYTKPFNYPGLYPWQKANMISWIFTGVQLTPIEWDGTLAARNALR